jgi:acid phosphatase class B
MKPQVISFDFDDTICMANCVPNYKIIKLINNYVSQGYRCVIVTARNIEHEKLKNGIDDISVLDFCKKYNVLIKDFVFTNHKYKGPFLRDIGAIKHYDDSIVHLESAKEHGIDGVLVE